jgi:glucosamine--fructose-6-phosphate aminotransferase (isomerizing)
LGGKHERIRNIVQEGGVNWDDKHLELLEMEDLFGLSAEKIGDRIITGVNS